MRRIAATLAATALLAGCSHQPPAYESKYTPSNAAKTAAEQPVALIGDSYTGGSPEGGTGDKGWPELVDKQLEGHGVNVKFAEGSEGASGYVARGHRGGVFGDKVAQVVKPDDRLVVLFGSVNDGKYLGELEPAVQSALAAVKTAAPAAKVLVIGPAWPPTQTAGNVAQVESILQTQAEAAGATFVDAQQWFDGHPELIGSDGWHPTDAGHALLAEKIGPLIAQQLQP